MKQRASVFLLVLLFPFLLAAQQVLPVRSSVKKGRVSLRWVPVSPAIWKQLRQNGIEIDRLPVAPGTTAVTDFTNAQRLTPAPLFPLAQNDTASWRKLIAANRNAALTYAFLYDNAPLKPGTTPRQKQDAENMRFGLALLSADLDPAIGNALALLFVDSLVDASQVYAYRVRPAKPVAGMGGTIIIVDARSETIYPAVQSLSGKFRNRVVKLTWDAKAFETTYSAYRIERSADSINYETVSKTPVVMVWSQFEKNKTTLTFNDTFPENNRKYFYRIRGINPFGEVCAPSNVISGKGYVPPSGFPVIDSVRNVKNTTLKLNWHLSVPDDEKHITQLRVLRAPKEAGPYAPLGNALPASANTFSDDKPERLNFYKIAALDKGGDTVLSFSAMGLTYDETPPAVPAGLKATIDDNGVVQLKWTPNADADLQGYRVFKTNHLKEEFTEVTRKILTVADFRDTITLRTLTPDVYYQVQAVDQTFNNSKPCAPVKVLRPDTIRPVAALLKDVHGTYKGVEMKIIPSSSTDVSWYALYRKTDETGPAKKDTLLRKWDHKDSLTFFADTAVEAGHAYRYRLLTFDNSENFSTSNQPYLVFENGVRSPITTLRGRAEREGKFIELTWNYPSKEVFRYVIYKAKKGEEMRVYKTLDGRSISLTDKQVQIGNVYVYTIKAVLKNGAETTMSPVIEIEY